MRNSIYILAFIGLTFSNFAFGQTIQKDTTYIWKDNLQGFKQSIFYETNLNSEYYKGITDFSFGQFDKESYDNSLDYLRKENLFLKNSKPILTETRWITLKQYKGQFYAYYPCDFYTYFKVSISDTTYIDWTGEGPVANKIAKQKKFNDTTFIITTLGIYDINRQVTIHLIDKSKGIAIFEEQTKDGISFNLMISADKIKSVPFIVNNCKTRKQLELKFEEPDYKKLLKRK
jgi:hypothetical protein